MALSVAVVCDAWCPGYCRPIWRRFDQPKSTGTMSRQLGSDDDASNGGSDSEDISDNDKASLWFSSDETVPLSPAQESLRRYVESVKEGLKDEDFATIEGVDCEGEPSVDPSRQVQSQGDSEWMDDW